MPFEISATDEPKTILLRAYGAGNAGEGQRALQAVQAHEAHNQGIGILIDAVELEFRPSDGESRVFAGLFATAFPCSPIAIIAKSGQCYESAVCITTLSVDRGARVAAFTDRHEAIAWLAACAPAAPIEFPESGLLSDAKLIPEEVVIPYALRERIETTRVDVDGHDCALRLDSAQGRPVLEPEVAEVTVSTEYRGSARRATVDLRVSSLDDEEYVVSAVVNAMRVVLAGAPPRRARYRISCPPLTSIVSPTT
ncbi:MAG: hypothetical protein V7647_2496 [Acidobacteriota bacterium]|jgi:hypothetical protein